MTGQSESCQHLSAVTALSSPPPRAYYANIDPETSCWFRSFLLRRPQFRGRDSGLGSESKWKIFYCRTKSPAVTTTVSAGTPRPPPQVAKPLLPALALKSLVS